MSNDQDDSSINTPTSAGHLKPFVILWKGWTMPPNSALLQQHSDPELRAVRHLAIALIAGLTLCLRGFTYSAAASGAVAGIIAFLVDHFVRGDRAKAISVYGVFIALLCGALIIPILPGQWILEPINSFLKNFDLTFLIPIALSAILTFGIWFLKARLLDGNQITPQVLGSSLLISVIALSVVVLAAWVPDKLFGAIVSR